MITVRIDVKKIDKSKLFVGEKGTYLDLVLIESKNDQYGNDWMVTQSISKEERQAGKKGAILGNGKNVGANKTTPPASGGSDLSSEGMDGLPF